MIHGRRQLNSRWRQVPGGEHHARRLSVSHRKELHPHAPLPARDDLWKPIVFSDAETRGQEEGWNYGVIARLAPGATIAQAQQELDSICAAISQTLPADAHFTLGAHIKLLRTVYSGDVRQSLVALAGAVGLLLLIACVNLANLLLARLGSRGREFATRAALGAPRMRLVRQLLTECVAIALAGGVAGLALAEAGTRALIAMAPRDLTGVRAAGLSAPVLWFAALVSIATAVAFGLIPAWQTARRDLHENLKEGARGVTSERRSGRMRRVLAPSKWRCPPRCFRSPGCCSTVSFRLCVSIKASTPSAS
jgi:putative ABC transport system permease protein